MPKLKTIDNHAAIAASDNITQICRPLFRSTDITFFNYVRMYDDGRRLSVGSNPAWLTHYFINQYQEYAVFKNTPAFHTTKLILWDGYVDNLVMNHASEEFDIAHGLTLTDKKAENYCDFIHFATKRKNHHIINTYVNQLDYFNQFKLYFQEAARSILSSIKPYEPVTPVNMQTADVCEFVNTEGSALNLLRRYHVNGHLGKTYLTQQEMRCVMLAGKRLTAKEKLGCISIFDLRQLAVKMFD